MTRMIFIMFLSLVSNTIYGIEIYVSTQGNDLDSGEITAPLKTLLAARNKIRYYKKNSDIVDFKVLLRQGVYEQETTFLLTEEDSGLATNPIIYKAYNGEDVRVSGGKVLENTQLSKLHDTRVLNRLQKKVRDRVLAISLRGIGIHNYGSLTSRGIGAKRSQSPLELFINRIPQKIAQWPNDQWAKTSSPYRKHSNFSGFYYDYEKPNNWFEKKDIWLHGYWQHEWADSYIKLKKIDKNNRIHVAPLKGERQSYNKGRRWRAINILEELDAPSEYYIDKRLGYLYFIPPKNTIIKIIAVSILESPILQFKNTKHINFQNISFEYGRGEGIVIERGSKIVIDHCNVSNFGQSGISIRNGSDHTVKNSSINSIGESAIIVNGGDRITLKRADHMILDNHIFQFGRWVQAYSAGVLISGVGNKVINNKIYNGPHAGIIFTGNDHLIQQNEIYNVARQAGDVGVIYTGRDWSMRGTVIKYNYIHDSISKNKGGVMGIYLDDLASGISINGNIIEGVHKCILVGGGRDNVVENNILANCEIPIWADDRGRDSKNDKIVNAKLHSSWNLFEKLNNIKFKQPPYSTHYPRLAKILDDFPLAPKGNKIVGNVIVARSDKEILKTDSEYTRKLFTIKDNAVINERHKADLTLEELLKTFPYHNFKVDEIAYKSLKNFILMINQKEGESKD